MHNAKRQRLVTMLRGTALSSILAVTVASPMAQAPAAKPWDESFRTLPQPANIKSYMQRLSARPHHVGSAYDKDNAEWILAKFKDWGWQAEIERFDVLFPTPKERRLELLAPAGDFLLLNAGVGFGFIAGKRRTQTGVRLTPCSFSHSYCFIPPRNKVCLLIYHPLSSKAAGFPILHVFGVLYGSFQNADFLARFFRLEVSKFAAFEQCDFIHRANSSKSLLPPSAPVPARPTPTSRGGSRYRFSRCRGIASSARTPHVWRLFLPSWDCR
jgi:hypothetical protein